MGSGTLTDTMVKKFSDGSLTIQDSGAVNSVTLTLEEGSGVTIDWNIGFTSHKNRGAFHHRRAGEWNPVTLSFSVKYSSFYASGTDYNPFEALQGIGGCSGWTSSATNTSDVFSSDIVWKLEDPDAGAAVYETVTLSDCAVQTISFKEGETENMLDFTVECASYAVGHNA